MASTVKWVTNVKSAYFKNSTRWGLSPDQKRQHAVELAAQEILDARAKYQTCSLADLYDPRSMPPELVKAHQNLDKAVDAAYSKAIFKTEAERVAFLFEQYQQFALGSGGRKLENVTQLLCKNESTR